MEIKEKKKTLEAINYDTMTPDPKTIFVYKQEGLLDMKVEKLKLVCSFNDGSIVIIDIATSKVLQKCPPLYKSQVQGQLSSANISIDDYCSMVCYMGTS